MIVRTYAAHCINAGSANARNSRIVDISGREFSVVPVPCYTWASRQSSRVVKCTGQFDLIVD